MSACTWKGCGKPATNPQLDRDGKQWAQLCDEHDAELEAAIRQIDAKKMLSAWIKAQGGAALAARRMT